MAIIRDGERVVEAMTAALILIAVLPFVQILIQRLRGPQSESLRMDFERPPGGLHNIDDGNKISVNKDLSDAPGARVKSSSPAPWPPLA